MYIQGYTTSLSINKNVNKLHNLSAIRFASDKPLPNLLQNNWILYDGDCYFCEHYTAYTRLKQAIGPIQLLNARENPPELAAVQAKGLDFNQGMVLCYQGKLYHGGECLYMLAILSDSKGLFNRLNAFTFSNRGVAVCLYPTLRAARNLTLILTRKKRRLEKG